MVISVTFDVWVDRVENGVDGETDAVVDNEEDSIEFVEDWARVVEAMLIPRSSPFELSLLPPDPPPA